MTSKILWILIILELAAAAGAQDASGPRALRLVLLTPSCAVVEVNARAPGSLRLRFAQGAWRKLGSRGDVQNGLVLIDRLEAGATCQIRVDKKAALEVMVPRPPAALVMRNQIRGGWLGKVIGNEFGLPFEQAGLFRLTRKPYARDLTYYDSSSDGVQGRIPVNHYVNDDTGLAYIGLLCVEQHGLHFTSRQLARIWLHHLDGYDQHLWCAEPYAVKNIKQGIWPPLSGAPEHNPYSRHLDAQMRADIWGLLAPGDLTLAVDLARRDAQVSNHGEGVEGALLVAAMTSAAFYERRPDHIIEAACATLPRSSLHRRVALDVLSWWRKSPSAWRPVWQRLQKKYAQGRYEPYGGHAESMILAAPNAGIIVMALLYGGGDFGRTLSIAASASWDTDCNAGNAGAVVGVLTTASLIPARWKKPLHDEFSIRDFYGNLPAVLSIQAIADRIFKASRRR